MRLGGRVAIVTGAAHGIGRAICAELAREGASVWACDVLTSELVETRRTVEAISAGSCRTAEIDVRDPEAVTAFVSRIDAAGGRIDALVNSAGGVAGQTMQAIEQVTDEDWRVILAINLDGAFTRAAAPAMKRAGRGAIVHISSGAGRSYSLTGIQATAWPPASCARIRLPRGSGEPWVRRASGASSTRSPSAGWACPRRSRGPSSSFSPTTRPMSPGRPSASTVATGCSADAAKGDVL
jgi:NAD(P)-dependent dehydrogenase (short-subunit alcohol dehydrogenase family)